VTARIFLLSPANLAGDRARLVLRPEARFPLAVQLRERGAPLGEVMAFVSGLYFRGKRAYAHAFALPPRGVAGGYVITSNRGLLPLEAPVRLPDLLELAEGTIHHRDRAYRDALGTSVRRLVRRIGRGCEVVLLGSVASDKYVHVLLEILGERLLFPPTFVGRGDMSRGGLMLRCARVRLELPYAPVLGSARHGPRPPRLEPLPPARRRGP
jgi:hypothetical protein